MPCGTASSTAKVSTVRIRGAVWQSDASSRVVQSELQRERKGVGVAREGLRMRGEPGGEEARERARAREPDRERYRSRNRSRNRTAGREEEPERERERARGGEVRGPSCARRRRGVPCGRAPSAPRTPSR
eukprot:3719243-Rhodomonas_salina.1